MSASPFHPLDRAGWPDAYRLLNARVPVAVVERVPDLAADADGLALVDITVTRGRVEAIAPAGGPRPDERPAADLDRGIVLPLFVDMHTHLDKGHIWSRRANPDGRFMSALLAVKDDRERHWSAEDVRRRMGFALGCAFAHGTRAIRTHLDSIAPQDAVSWPVFDEIRRDWTGRVALEAVALVGPDGMLDREGLDRLARTVKRFGGVLGGAIAVFPDSRQAIANAVAVAKEHGLALDLHVDETEDPASRSLLDLAEEVIAQGFDGPVVAGHCCALAVNGADLQDRTLDAVARAGIAVVSLPLCNLYLQDRHLLGDDDAGRGPRRTPRWRGVTLLHEMRARGIRVAVASDNTRDPFYAYGDLDGLEVMREATRILHLDHPWGDWLGIMSRMPADILGASGAGRLAPGLPADLIAVRARTPTELFARPQSDRVVIRDGRRSDAAPPDYRDLDDLLGAP
jgi:cytosine/creatinine deaminase